MRRFIYILVYTLLIVFVLAAFAGHVIGPGMLHPLRLNMERDGLYIAMAERTGAVKEDFTVIAPDGIELRGWKVRARQPNNDWVLLYHGVSDNRTGTLGVSEILLDHGYSVVMMDSRAHGQSGGNMATYGWKERNDSVAIVRRLYATSTVRHLYAFGVSMGAAISLQSAALEPRIEGVIAEDPFENLREVSYDYAGLWFSPFLGKTLFRPASIFAMRAIGETGDFHPDDVSPEEAVARRAFPVLLICGTRDRKIPCRHAEAIYRTSTGPKELWEVEGAEHASALGKSPSEYEDRVINFLEQTSQNIEAHHE